MRHKARFQGDPTRSPHNVYVVFLRNPKRRRQGRLLRRHDRAHARGALRQPQSRHQVARQSCAGSASGSCPCSTSTSTRCRTRRAQNGRGVGGVAAEAGVRGVRGALSKRFNDSRPQELNRRRGEGKNKNFLFCLLLCPLTRSSAGTAPAGRATPRRNRSSPAAASGSACRSPRRSRCRPPAGSAAAPARRGRSAGCRW